jgi:hypothetical protein
MKPDDVELGETDIPLTQNFGKRIGTVTKLWQDEEGYICFEADMDMRKLSEEQANAIFGDVKGRHNHEGNG